MFTDFLPLWCGIAPQENAQQLVNINYRADDRLCAQCGTRSLSSREAMYSMEFSSNPSNWLGPVWIIVNYFAWKALRRYGYKKEADALANKTILLLSSDLEANGSLNEYYHPDTAAYALTYHLMHSDPLVQLFGRWARTRIARRFSLDSAAKAVGASKRTHTRRLQSVLGKSPMSYFQSLRVERAVHLLKTSKASVEEIAAKVGYMNDGKLRLLLRRLNLGVKEIRRASRVYRHNSPGPPI
jgi:AraC-like DNA-binding protein